MGCSGQVECAGLNQEPSTCIALFKRAPLGCEERAAEGEVY